MSSLTNSTLFLVSIILISGVMMSTSIPDSNASIPSYYYSNLTIDHPPKLGDTAVLTLEVLAVGGNTDDFPDYRTTIRLPEGFELVSGDLVQTNLWKAGESLSVSESTKNPVYIPSNITKANPNIIQGIGDASFQTTNINDVKDTDDVKQYKPPLRQIRDDGVSPKDVKCNEGMVLFFRVANESPVCIYEDSIKKLDNKWIGWYAPSSPHFMRLFDAEYLVQKNSLLDRHVTVVYSIDEQNNDIVYNIREEIKKTTDEFLIYNVIDQHKKIPGKIFIKDAFSRNFGFSIVSNDGLDPVAWSDPRTSVKNVRNTIEDYGKLFKITCDSNDNIGGLRIYEQSSFKILDEFEIVTIQYDEQVVVNNYLNNDDYTFNDLFFSQGKTEFIFQDDLIPIEITELNCMLGPDMPYFVYQISFAIKNE